MEFDLDTDDFEQHIAEDIANVAMDNLKDMHMLGVILLSSLILPPCFPSFYLNMKNPILAFLKSFNL